MAGLGFDHPKPTRKALLSVGPRALSLRGMYCMRCSLSGGSTSGGSAWDQLARRSGLKNFANGTSQQLAGSSRFPSWFLVIPR